MKLNIDCIKDILTIVEEKDSLYLPDECTLLDYSTKEITYHVKQCISCGLFDVVRKYVDGGIRVVDLSPKGHEFLEGLRTKKIDTIKKVAVTSLVKAIEIATSFVPNII